MGTARAILIWAALVVALAVPLGVAASSPLLAWREPIYIVSGFAGAAAMGLLLLQPLLAGDYLPSLPRRRARSVHRILGILLVIAVLTHVIGLWITSPPDVIDALLFRSPTTFSAWGVIAMWAAFAAGLVAVLRRRLRLRPAVWRLCHLSMSTLVVLGSVVHAMLIEGTMGMISKAALCALVLTATVKIMIDMRPWTLSRGRKV
ncbi:MAG: ferric reductase-like transmembrane domain-containing protein [Paracoccaceae bacterium]